ncbi:MAG: beta-Ala-His dipeptidase [Oligoflexia bacterium]|nr:beta-Ala-His dipeptidase [Oligoflexia bacterium]
MSNNKDSKKNTNGNYNLNNDCNLIFPSDPAEVWQYFKEISSIPRASGNEEGIRNYLIDFAKKNNFSYKVDKAGNVYIYVSASDQYENHHPILIQNHMDMVCDSTSDVKIDFKNHPLELIVTEDGYVKAHKTTLGADNGIGMAVALALTSKNIKHPPLELLFTVDEETGLNGAQHIEKDFISSKRLLNFDTGNFGTFYVGCAGSIKVELKAKFKEEEESSNSVAYRLSVSGFTGGHSGGEINKQKANAIKFLIDCLNRLDSEKIEYSLHGFIAGKAHNIIPREAFAVICINKSIDLENKITNILKILNQAKNDWCSFLPSNDNQFSFTFNACPVHTEAESTKVLSLKDKKRFLSIVNLIPHGVESYCIHQHQHQDNEKKEEVSYSIPSLSSNFSLCKLHDGDMLLQSSIRFFNPQECFKLLNIFNQIASLAEIEINIKWSYPSWPVADYSENNLLKTISSNYESLFNKNPKILITHTGLECGIIVDRLRDGDLLTTNTNKKNKIEALSLGMNILAIHTPDERLEIASVQNFWKLITSAMKDF